MHNCFCNVRAVGIRGHCVSVLKKGGLVSSYLPHLLINMEQNSFLVFVHFLFHSSICISSCQKGFCVALNVNVSLLRPYSMLLYGKSRRKVMTQDHFVSPWSPRLTQGCIIIIAQYDSHTAPLRANAS